MVALKRAHLALAFAGRLDAFSGGLGSRKRREIRHLILDGGLTDAAVIGAGVTTSGRRIKIARPRKP